MKRKLIFGLLLALAAAGGAYVWFGGRAGGQSGVNDGESRISASGSGRTPLLAQKGANASAVKTLAALSASNTVDAVRSVTNQTGRVVQVVARGRVGSTGDDVFRDEDGRPYPEADQKIMSAAQAAIENDDLADARRLAAKALGSDNAELRSMVVDALSWFGRKAIADLTQFMGDADESVAEAAQDGWMSALQEIDDDGLKAGVIQAAMLSLSDADVLESVANELIGIDELSSVQVVANIITDGKNAAAVDAAKEAYNSITGDDWAGVDAAEEWLQEHYELPGFKDADAGAGSGEGVGAPVDGAAPFAPAGGVAQGM